MVKVNTLVTPEWKKIQDGFLTEGLEFVFRELLGWGLENPKVLPCVVGEETFAPKVIADLKGYRIFLVETSRLPSPKTQAQIDAKLSLQAPERITIFSDGSTMQWRWPHQTPSGGVSYESLSISASKMPSFLAQRLVGLRFTVQDFTQGVSLVDVRDRVRGRFDGAKVTKKFFDEFRKHHQHLARSIEGLDVEEDRSAYATLLMNRLMLLYFLQKREFLNDDPFYLENCLNQVQQSKGQDKFYSFYRDLLLPMFFDRLAAFAPKELDPEVARIIGDIPYINGGIYEPSPLEKEFGGELNVPDEIFEIVLGFFGKFNWHLDTRPSGSENEINPEVIGYIFEQYINYTAGGKKDNGAYYTKEDVTGYMVGSTLIPRILDYCAELEIPFLDLITENPLRYIHSDMLHGYEIETRTWLPVAHRLKEVWSDDPIHWHELDDAETDTAINLPGESWVETFYRRERVENLTQELAGGLVNEINDLVTHNLNSRLLLTDAIDRVENPDIVANLWSKVTSISVLDPTCGSGAFLFAAMEALEDVYHHLIDVMRTERSESASAKHIVEEIERHPNDRYFVRKSIALNNLYGTDLMPDAVETAKLRIFLALVSCLENKSEIEPLPDLDFNLKAGNLLVGFRDALDLERLSGDVLGTLALQMLGPRILEFIESYQRFVATSISGDSRETLRNKSELDTLIDSLREEADIAFCEIEGVPASSREAWMNLNRPFHWFIEFPMIQKRGGFDVLVGNPPYVATSSLTKEQKLQFSSFGSSECPDLYAPCIERALSLVERSGARVAVIVMLSLSVGKPFAPLRQLLYEGKFQEWWSTYGNFPAGLFAGAAVRNTILVLTPGTGSHVTRHHIFSARTRPYLFATIEYSPFARTGSNPPVRGGVCQEVADTLAKQSLPVSASGSDAVFVKPAGTYWFPVLPFAPPTYNEGFSVEKLVDSNLKRVGLLEVEEKAVAVSVLGGKIGYLWWSATGDNFNALAGQTVAPRALALEGLRNNQEVRLLATRVIENLHSAVILVFHKGIFVNLRWSSLYEFTDLFDRELLNAVGLGQAWKPLNIWYRQVMKSSGASSKDRIPPDGFAENLVEKLMAGSDSES